MKTITSPSNPAIKTVRSLHTKKGRKTHKQFIAQGERTVTTILNAGLIPDALYLTQEWISQFSSLVSPDIITLIPSTIALTISTETTASGVIAVFPIPYPPSPENLASTGLVLAQIQDPGNMGTLLRTAAAMNQRSIVIVEGVDPWSPKVVQATAGTIALLSIFQWSWNDLIAHKGDRSLCALVVDGGKKPENTSIHTSFLVVGNEANGIPAAWLEQCDYRVTLPMPGNTESLNAAVAGSIALYTAYTLRLSKQS